jgi:hypothetical protein
MILVHTYVNYAVARSFCYSKYLTVYLSFIFLCRLKINQMTELKFLHLFLEPEWSRTDTIIQKHVDFQGLLFHSTGYLLHGKLFSYLS